MVVVSRVLDRRVAVGGGVVGPAPATVAAAAAAAALQAQAAAAGVHWRQREGWNLREEKKNNSFTR